jgi:L-gulono-1,4-lactone dehydrogenase
MSAQNKSTTELLSTLAQDAKNSDHIAELKKRILAGDKALDSAAHTVYSSQLKSQPQSHSLLDKLFHHTTSWSNCISQQTCYPGEILKPKSLDDVVSAIKVARAKNVSLRAVGSGHSFSDVAPVYKGGILLDPHGMDRVLDLDLGSLQDPGTWSAANGSVLFSVESGITIKNLNDALDKKGLALANMGAYDGQTLAGAISTGTHGTGITLGPMASSVRAVVLVLETGSVFQIESSKGISKPDAFKERYPNRTLKQDDDWFNSILVAMGCMGVIYSYVLEVVPAYYLEESRTMSTWETVKMELTFGTGPDGTPTLPRVFEENRHYDVNINPYPVEGVHSCIVTTKNIVKASKPSGSRGIKNWIAGLLAGWPLAEQWLVWFLNLLPMTSPEIINNALTTLVDKNYIDKSYEVLGVGAVDNVKALAVELSFPADDNLVDAIDTLLEVFGDEASKMNWFIAGPVALRFVAASDAYMAPQYGRLTCMAELDMLAGINTGTELLQAITKRVQAGNDKVRVHWGLDLDTVEGKDLPKLYTKFQTWLNVYSQLNRNGMFNSPLTNRLGISMEGKEPV